MSLASQISALATRIGQEVKALYQALAGKEPSIPKSTGFLKYTGTAWEFKNESYLTSISKAMVEGVLTGNIGSHTHSYQPYNYDLALIAALTGTSGILRKNGVGNWNLDTTGYEPKLADGEGYSVLVIYGSTRVVLPIADAAEFFDFVGEGKVSQTKLASDLVGRQAVAASEIDWSQAAVHTKVLTADTTFTFANLQQNKVITLILSGNYTVTFPAFCKRISGTYDGSTTNYIQFHCTNNAAGSEEVWFTISKQAA